MVKCSDLLAEHDHRPYACLGDGFEAFCEWIDENR